MQKIWELRDTYGGKKSEYSEFEKLHDLTLRYLSVAEECYIYSKKKLEEDFKYMMEKLRKAQFELIQEMKRLKDLSNQIKIR